MSVAKQAETIAFSVWERKQARHLCERGSHDRAITTENYLTSCGGSDGERASDGG